MCVCFWPNWIDLINLNPGDPEKEERYRVKNAFVVTSYGVVYDLVSFRPSKIEKMSVGLVGQCVSFCGQLIWVHHNMVFGFVSSPFVPLRQCRKTFRPHFTRH